MKLEEIVPWGRCFEEYRAMFALNKGDLGKRILGAGDGPASFNAELSARGGSVVSVDPLYRFSREEIACRITDAAHRVLDQVRRSEADFVWKRIPDVQSLESLRMAAMGRFLEDYESGRAAGRYLDASLPVLPFEEQSFDLALCSHLLFLYSEQLDEAAHLRALRELCRVADEVRIYPLLTLAGEPSPHLTPLMEILAREGRRVRLQEVDYEFQRGATRMLVIG